MEGLQQGLAVFGVLAVLGGMSYWLRHKGMAQFAFKGAARGNQRRLRSIERLALTPQHSLHLVSVDGKVLLVAVSPRGCQPLDGALNAAAPSCPSEDRMVNR